MSFDPKKLPPDVYAAFKQGPMAWALVVERAIGLTDYSLDKLTDIVFYLHYPERIGKPLKSHEIKLITKWKAFRTLIKPRYDVRMATRKRFHDENMATPYPNRGGGSSFNFSKIDLGEEWD